MHRAGAPEHEGVGLTPLGSKLSTDWLAIYDAQLKSTRSERGGLGFSLARSLARSYSRASQPAKPASQPASQQAATARRGAACGERRAAWRRVAGDGGKGRQRASHVLYGAQPKKIHREHFYSLSGKRGASSGRRDGERTPEDVRRRSTIG